MRLSKKAANKAGSEYSLANENLLERDSTKWRGPKWNEDLDELTIRIKSKRYYGSQYDYTIALSKQEILGFISLAIEQSASHRQEKALGMGAIKVIEELMKPVNPSDT